MGWPAVALCGIAAAVLAAPAPVRAQAETSPLPVSLERIRKALNEPPPRLPPPPPSSEMPTFRVEVNQGFPVMPAPVEEPFDPTWGLPSAGQLMMGGIQKVGSAVASYKRGRAKRRARKEVDDALAAFCAAHECPPPQPTPK